ncbi:amino acid adenylation domain-containing protein [Fulvivirgaceae bacterium PWU4]|uniref:Amino acid adenylation domain-containing protein n=1 Tax=Chryseosolibacter histidini TaxID=2782349 RepID=A0AAP2DGZ9_9BACT|nr:non-ribosomal peptide synthetase [Chryseosolibacter histidini]MBT1695434.1 amino acid adenylation domain-containing protein [Chryseosolibacter histidini]
MQPANLIEALEAVRYSHAGITFLKEGNREEFLPYDTLYHRALNALSYLQQKGISPKDEVVFQIDDLSTFLVLFWGCVLGNMIPVPLATGRTDDHVQKLFNVWPVLDNAYLVAQADALQKLGEFASRRGYGTTYAAIVDRVIDVEAVLASTSQGNIHPVKEDDIAFIQFSSGSTGAPKGVVLTHKNLLTNMTAISRAAGYSATDSMISWMPLTHDMGLIGFHLNPLLCGMNQYLIPTSLFVRRPALWLDKASEYGISILCSPNFGYKYLLKHCATADEYSWDLSRVRILYNGAEPVSDTLCHEFMQRFGQYGLRSSAMCPVYGLAEASLAVTISGIEDEVISVHLDRNQLMVGGKVSENASRDQSVSFVNVGKPIDHCQVRITDENNAEVGDDTIGHIQIKGNNVTSGYYNNEAETDNAIGRDGWLRTGDLGFFRHNTLYVTGRAKDIFFVNGQNYYPHDIERIAETIEGVELNKVVVAGFFNAATGRDEIVAFVFHRASLETFVPIANALRSVVNLRAGLEIDRVVPVKDIPRTTSGKLQRFKLLEQYREGYFKDAIEALEPMLTGEPDAKAFDRGDKLSSTEERLLAIWKEVLKTDTVTLTDRFFEIGGNSLKAAEAGMMVQRQLGVDLPFEVLYTNQTIAALAKEIDARESVMQKPVPVIEKAAHYALSSAQRRLYYLWAADKSSTGYNIPVAFRISGVVDARRLEQAIRAVIRRHDSLRTTFRAGAEPRFIVHDSTRFFLETQPCTQSDLHVQLKALVQPFDLGGPLFRARLLTISPAEHVLFFDFHHIIADGLSIGYFLDELLQCYAGKTLPEQRVQYKDYTAWERSEVTKQSQALKRYWQHYLHGLPVLEMPLDFTRPAVWSTEGGKVAFNLDKQITERLRRLAETHQCTFQVLLLAVYHVLLSKYTAQEDIVIGIPVSGRRHADLLRVQGMFVNNLAIRTPARADQTFTEYMKAVKQNVIAALDHQDLAFEDIVPLVQTARDVSRNVVFDTMFNYQNMDMPAVPGCGFSVQPYFFDPGISKFDLSLEVFDNSDRPQFAFEYSTHLFQSATIDRLVGHFTNLVLDVLNDPSQRLCDLSLLKAHDHQKLIFTFNATERSYPLHKTVHQLFEEQARSAPDRIAIEFGDDRITYGQLNAQANDLAVHLREQGLLPNGIAAILLRRSPKLVISLLAVLKAGGCYLPVDPDLPAERIDFLIADSRCQLIIAGKNFQGALSPMFDIPVVDTDVQPLASQGFSLASTTNASDLAYIIYTSGTTGSPKGVMIGHRSLTNYSCWAAEHYCKGEQVAFPLFTSISFDLTVTSIFTPLITGNRIVIYEESERNLALADVISDNKCDVIKLTPSHLRLLAEGQWPFSEIRVKRFIVGGEQLETSLARKIFDAFQGKVEIYNEYGPTEATVGCMIHRFDPEEERIAVPIGVPAANTRIYVLDKFLKPVPEGVSGELYIAGDGLAKGYLNQESLTNARFVPDPFVQEQKMYKTGDLARILPEGYIEFIGRADLQVKINGHRIELQEIERHLVGYPGITTALVTVNVNKKGEKNLYAYYQRTEPVDETVIQHYLTRRLPYYMIPLRFTHIAEIPLTQNGKIAYDLLPAPAERVAETTRHDDTMEALMVKIWGDVLGEERISRSDNFFELGGDSIKAVQVVSRLADHQIHLPVKDILTYQSIGQILLHARVAHVSKHYTQGLVEGARALTPIETWFACQPFNKPGYYNQSILLTLNRKTDPRLLNEAFKYLVRQHDGLRMNYDSDRRVVFFNPQHLNGFTVEEYHAGSGGSIDSVTEACEKVKSGFDLASGTLLKAALIRRQDAHDLLLITAHHLVVDGVSWRILLEDLHFFYHSLEKGETVGNLRKTASLIDWQRALSALAADRNLDAETDYWQEVEQVPFTIPCDHETTDWTEMYSDTLSVTTTREHTASLLRQKGKQHQSDVPVLLTAALAQTLKRWTGSSHLVIEMENHGRHLEDTDVSRTVGWFTALYPVAIRLPEGPVDDQLRSVREQLHAIPNHGLGYGLRKYPPVRHLPSRIAEVRLNYLGQFGRELHNELFSISDIPHGRESDPANVMTAKLEINAMVIREHLNLSIKYNRRAHNATTIRWFAAAFSDCLAGILVSKDKSDDALVASDFDAVGLDEKTFNALFS